MHRVKCSSPVLQYNSFSAWITHIMFDVYCRLFDQCTNDSVFVWTSNFRACGPSDTVNMTGTSVCDVNKKGQYPSMLFAVKLKDPPGKLFVSI